MDMAQFRTTLKTGILFVASVTFLVVAPGSASQQPRGMAPSSEARKSSDQQQQEQQADLQARRAQFAREYFLREKKDVDQILALATEFKDYGGHATNPVVTPEMLRKIHKMEDLVHDLRKLMFAGDAPRIKKSGTDLFVATQNAAVGSTEGRSHEPDKRLQQASSLSFELATRLSDTTYRYLDQANQNKISVASLATAKEVVSIAATLEGLEHEVQQAYRVQPKTD